MATYNMDYMIKGFSFNRITPAHGIPETDFHVSVIVEEAEARLIKNEADRYGPIIGGRLPLLFNDDPNNPIGILYFSKDAISVADAGSKKELTFRGELCPDFGFGAARDVLKLCTSGAAVSFGLQCERISSERMRVWSASVRTRPQPPVAIISETQKRNLLVSKVKCIHCKSPNNLERERCNSCGAPLEFGENNIIRVYE